VDVPANASIRQSGQAKVTGLAAANASTVPDKKLAPPGRL